MPWQSPGPPHRCRWPALSAHLRTQSAAWRCIYPRRATPGSAQRCAQAHCCVCEPAVCHQVLVSYQSVEHHWVHQPIQQRWFQREYLQHLYVEQCLGKGCNITFSAQASLMIVGMCSSDAPDCAMAVTAVRRERRSSSSDSPARRSKSGRRFTLVISACMQSSAWSLRSADNLTPSVLLLLLANLN